MDPATLEPLLLPRPRSLRLGGARVKPPRREDGSVIASESIGALPQGPEAYTLSVRAGAIEIRAASAPALQHARATLAQLQTQYGDSWPTLEIEDWPAFASRGFMLDISRDRVPTNEHLAHLVGVLASLKMNHLQLYTEHTFAYQGHEEVWRDASPITPDEARDLDRLCRARQIALAANQNCFGHLKRWLELPRYAQLAETQGTWKFLEWDRTGPFSLCPGDPGSIALVRDLLSQLLPCFTSGLVNIGCDETFDVGQGRSRSAVEARGFAPVYFDFVNQVCEVARERLFRPMFWADIALSHPESIPLIPRDAIALAWGYEPDAPFDEWLARLRAAGIEAWVCPGTSSWLSFTGRTTERRENMLAAARAGLKHGATGMLACEWGDQGHLQQWLISVRALADGAEAAWNGGLADPRAVSLHIFGDRHLRIAPWLDELGDADLPLRRMGGKARPDGSREPMRNATALFRDMFTPWDQPLPYDPPELRSADRWRDLFRRLTELGDQVMPSEFPWCRNAGEVLSLTMSCALSAAERAVERRRHREPAYRDLMGKRLASIIAQHRLLWLETSRPGGLERSAAWLMRVRNELASP